MQLHDFVRIVLQWHKTNRREFDWRKTTDPYKILVAEILLHRTDSQKIEKVYRRFIEKCPTIYHLHRIEQKQVFSMIRGIGLFYRAERLKEIADQVVNKFDGRIPDKKEELILLQGVGQYISNAVLCFAFKKRVPIVDTNVIRVYSRAFHIKSLRTRPRTDKQLWIFAEKMLPEEKFVEYNYALLDFASVICKAKNPLCNVCKAKSVCRNPVL